MSIRINIYIDGQDDQHGLRRWTQVPRVGEGMAVQIQGEIVVLTVKAIVWGVTAASREHEDAEVSLVLAAPDSP